MMYSVVVQTYDVKEWAEWLESAMDEKALQERNIYIQVCPPCLFKAGAVPRGVGLVGLA